MARNVGNNFVVTLEAILLAMEKIFLAMWNRLFLRCRHLCFLRYIEIPIAAVNWAEFFVTLYENPIARAGKAIFAR